MNLHKIMCKFLQFLNQYPCKYVKMFWNIVMVSQNLFLFIHCRVGSWRYPQLSKIQRSASAKHFSLLQTNVNYRRKKFYNNGPWMFQRIGQWLLADVFIQKNVLAYSGTIATFYCSIYRTFRMYFNKRLWRENENWPFEQIDENF